ncbi:sulfur carrier protein ThiS [Clostridium luticellarii]|jgi:sulfur carrier protein|uniref:Sulfur carrier protein ThiS n=1 Tax=Clostridium luticellarii TaxID=1691940 RepID=A0A2T0BHZ0_9CLOT|nr:sulfur carrier protein ThiS [Clostridium luticellarii]MCI1945978.1 sulfur carrier protein ThiS [Clostridium luticellarii]MCI1969665.1 sulfur carrier protein ThiS [Clostridium luticellarii]MCI1996654.1 sulfur carrier protein ThiS [Clostridium luticellarii]MCI2039580.1 sulfur carrier protein ThiS [Clostridium luticellarii]PRR83498.1 sulfur carrier protein ThiS [Clostridium luticellarii]
MIVNGEELDITPGTTVSQLLNKLNIDENTVVVEVDLDLLDRDRYKARKLSSTSKVEIIRYVGGG